MNPNSDYSQGSSQTYPVNISRRKKTLLIVAAAVVVVAAVGTGAALTRKQADRQVSASSAPAARVDITSNGLSSDTIKVRKNQAVVWHVTDGEQHELFLSSGTKDVPGSGAPVHLTKDQSYSYVFDADGTYHYYDALHPLAYNGQIIVSD